MRVTITLDYPDELVEKHGIHDAAATFLARLEEVYPGTAGDVLLLGTARLGTHADGACVVPVRVQVGDEYAIEAGNDFFREVPVA